MSRISEVRQLRKGKRYVVQDLFEFCQTGVVDGQAVGHFHATGAVPDFLDRLHTAGIDLPPEMFTERILEWPREDLPSDGMELEVNP